VITVEELIEQAYEIDMKDGMVAARWCDAARKCLGAQNVGGHGFYTAVGFPFDAMWSAAEMRLAYMLGRVESDLFEWFDDGLRRQIRARHISQGMCDWDEQRAAAQQAYQLKAEGIRDFAARVAKGKGVHSATVRRWMKRYPPATRA